MWVFRGIERDSKNCFLTTVEDRRRADTLIPIIKGNVLPGTTIISDCGKSYSRLSEEGYTHQTVNHSKEFVNKETWAHTNTIESIGGQKRHLSQSTEQLNPCTTPTSSSTFSGKGT